MKIGSLLAALFPELDRSLRAEDSPETLGSWDSIKQVDIILTVEEAFEIGLTTKEITELQSLGSLVRILRERGLDAEL